MLSSSGQSYCFLHDLYFDFSQKKTKAIICVLELFIGTIYLVIFAVLRLYAQMNKTAVIFFGWIRSQRCLTSLGVSQNFIRKSVL